MPHSRVVPGSDWRLAFDIGPLRARPAGVGVYVVRLAAALAEQLPNRLVLVGRRADAALGGPPLAGLPATPFRHRHYHAWMQLEAPRATRRSRADLAHFTNAAAPLAGGRPYVLTVHDLSVLRMPRSHPAARLATLPVTVAAVAAARRLIVPSHATAQELARLLRVDERRIRVVEHAASGVIDENGAGEEMRLTAESRPLLERLGLRPAGYVLALGTIEPRKNHVRLVAAFESLIAAGHDLTLVIVGELGWHAGALLRRIDASPQRERIVRLGYVDAPDLRALLEHSVTVCYVSLYEGYGLPVIEAMAAGAAVVTSSVSSMPQVAGGSAVLVDPYDVADIRRGIEEAMGRRAELAIAGRARAASRSWADVARETIAVYEEALAG